MRNISMALPQDRDYRLISAWLREPPPPMPTDPPCRWCGLPYRPGHFYDHVTSLLHQKWLREQRWKRHP